MDYTDLMKKRKIGDYEMIHQMTGVSLDSVRQHFYRKGGPYMDQIMKALQKIIKNRESLTNTNTR